MKKKNLIMVFEFYQKAYEAKVNRVVKKYLRHTIYYCPKKNRRCFQENDFVNKIFFPNIILVELYSDEN